MSDLGTEFVTALEEDKVGAGPEPTLAADPEKGFAGGWGLVSRAGCTKPTLLPSP